MNKEQLLQLVISIAAAAFGGFMVYLYGPLEERMTAAEVRTQNAAIERAEMRVELKHLASKMKK